MDYSALDPFGISKGTPRKRLKGRKQRAGGKVVTRVRADVVLRDGYCRWLSVGLGACSGPSEWAHAPWNTRAHSRGMEPDERHSTADTLMCCRRHHQELDGRAYPRLQITALESQKGADGRLRGLRDGSVYEEPEK